MTDGYVKQIAGTVGRSHVNLAACLDAMTVCVDQNSTLLLRFEMAKPLRTKLRTGQNPARVLRLTGTGSR